jgi:DNA invertase Pin-like site-specific DNA recombinase
VVWALDRFSREGILEVSNHVDRLKKFGVQFESFTAPHFRTTGPAGELMLAVSAWIAKQERIRISERTKAGLETARKKGKTIRRPRLVCDRTKVVELRAAGASWAKIETETGLSRSTVRRICAAIAG